MCLCACFVVQLCPVLCDPLDCSLPGSSGHGISQARTLEWVSISSSRGSSRPRDRTHISYWQVGSLLLSNQESPSFNFRLVFQGPCCLQAFITHKSLSSKLQSERIRLGKQKDTLGHCSSALSFLSTSLLWGGNKDSSLNFRRNENDFSLGCGVTSPTSSVCCQLRFTCPYRFSGGPSPPNLVIECKPQSRNSKE